jgi:hypothetical protein
MLTLLTVPQTLFNTARDAWVLAPLMRWVCEANGFVCRADYTFPYTWDQCSHVGERIDRIRADTVRNKEVRTSEDGPE